MPRRVCSGAQVKVYLVEGAGCGGCALEAQEALSARRGTVPAGVVPVEAPAHADVLVLCGALPTPLAEEVERLARSLHEPWACVRLGDCAAGEVLAGRERPVPGCPPNPEEVRAAILRAWEERRSGPTEGPEERP